MDASERWETEEPRERARETEEAREAAGEEASGLEAAGEEGDYLEAAVEEAAGRPPDEEAAGRSPDAAAKLRVKNETMARLAMALRQVLNAASIQP